MEETEKQENSFLLSCDVLRIRREGNIIWICDYTDDEAFVAVKLTRGQWKHFSQLWGNYES